MQEARAQATAAPSVIEQQVPVLWQFRMSHYNEKARWALDYKRIPHVRETVIPGLHVPRMMLLSRQKQVPVLVDGGETIAGSAAIIEHVERSHPEPPLYPSEPTERQRALELARFFDEELGPYLRRALFYELLSDAGYCTAIFTHGSGLATRTLYRASFPLVRAVMKLDMDITEGSAADAVEKTLVALESLDNLIQPSGYLVGTAFSVADLTAAALISPVVQPPQFPYQFPPPNAGLTRLRKRLGHKRVREWCLSIYEKHRGTSAEVA
jgi:glutathione S-transferase